MTAPHCDHYKLVQNIHIIIIFISSSPSFSACRSLIDTHVRVLCTSSRPFFCLRSEQPSSGGQNVLISKNHLHKNTENIAGKLTFYQMDGNSTYVRNTGELASDVPTETMFELFDPLQNFSSAKFSYTWDLGNGEVIQGTEPVVRYLYTHSGNYTLQLKVGVNLNKSAPEITEVYSTDLKVLDAIKNIELKGPSNYEVSENYSLAFHVDGSLRNCVPEKSIGCTMTKLYENTLRLNHTFTSAGVHCLDISVSNDISKLQTSFSLYAKKSNNNHLIFMLSCAAVLTATFSFITVIACRPCHHGRSQIAVSTNAVFLKSQTSGGQGRIFLNFSHMERGEREPLILQSRSQ
ncbi:transmembrane protein 130 [Cynoglossus semilaevis]|uniref:transmembrane protein 130 n=1 Tax=Cynoglossus semilaevis TaxID=244447 RepID=UPI000D627D4C|nr:uncharacterized protein LOC103382410 [Cynoglossus semilaevis]